MSGQPPRPADERDRQEPAEPLLSPEDEDVDPLEGGSPAPGAPPGETFGSTPAVPTPEAARNERAGRKPPP